MAVHLTEEEQLESLKRWWAENGKSTVIAVVLAVTAYLGWGVWKDRQQASAESAAAIYQNLLAALEADQGQAPSEEQAANVHHLAGQLKQDFGSSLYASQAALFAAKLAVESGELDKAANELEWVIDKNVDPALTLVTRARLARVRIAEGKLDAAVALLAEPKNTAFTATFAELRGDILLQQGKVNDARAAYRLAIDNLVEGQESRSRLLQVKLDDLQTTPMVTVPAGNPGDSVPDDSPAMDVDARDGENS